MVFFFIELYCGSDENIQLLGTINFILLIKIKRAIHLHLRTFDEKLTLAFIVFINLVYNIEI